MQSANDWSWLFLPGIVAVIVGIAVYGRNRSMRLLNALAASYGGSVSCNYLGKSELTASLNGRSFIVRIVPGGKNTPPHLEVEMQANPPCEMHLLRHGLWDGMMSLFTSGKRMSCGAPDIDSAFVINASDETLATPFLSNPHIREALLALSTWRVERIELLPARYIKARKKLGDFEYELNQPTIDPALQALLTLAKQ